MIVVDVVAAVKWHLVNGRVNWPQWIYASNDKLLCHILKFEICLKKSIKLNNS